MPLPCGMVVRNMSPTVCCCSVKAISTSKACCLPSLPTMISFSFGSVGCGPVGSANCAQASPERRATPGRRAAPVGGDGRLAPAGGADSCGCNLLDQVADFVADRSGARGVEQGGEPVGR